MIEEKLLNQAIKVLKEHNEKHYGDVSKKRNLLEDEKVYLQFSLQKIPKSKSIKMIKLTLPHSLVKDSYEICLIAGDLDKRNKKAEIEPDILHYKELLKKHGIKNISEVVTLRQLRTEYKPYEAKQKLLAAYDVFLADRKIAECLPKVLGRHFFKKRKFPIQITLNSPNLQQQIEKAIATKVFYLTGQGNSCNSEVAYLEMDEKEIAENVVTMAKTFCENLPGSWANVMGIYLKTSHSKAIPIYMSYDDPNKIHLEDETNDNDHNTFEVDELSTCPNSLVKVYKDGSVRTVRMKRMAETEISEATDINADTERKSKKKKKEILIGEGENSCVFTELNAETAAITGQSKQKKKKKGKVIDDSVEITNISADSEKKKKKKVKVNDDGGKSSTPTDLNVEIIDISADNKRKKKNKQNFIGDSGRTSETTELNGICPMRNPDPFMDPSQKFMLKNWTVHKRKS